MKKLCEDACRKHFAQLLAGRGIDWLRYESSGVKVSLTDAKQKTQPPKKLATQLAQFVERVAQEVMTISGMEDADEIMVEYQKSLNMSSAVAIVQGRKAAKAKAAEARAQAEAARQAEQKHVQHVQSFAPPAPVVAPVPVAAPAPVEQPVVRSGADDPNKVLCLRFQVTAPRWKLKELKKFLDDNKYEYQ